MNFGALLTSLLKSILSAYFTMHEIIIIMLQTSGCDADDSSINTEMLIVGSVPYAVYFWFWPLDLMKDLSESAALNNLIIQKPWLFF